MRIAEAQTKNKKIIAAIVVPTLLIVGYGVIAYSFGLAPFQGLVEDDISQELKENEVDTEQATDAQKYAGESSKSDFIDRNYIEDIDETGKPAGSDPAPETGSLSLTSVNQSGSTLMVRTMIGGSDDNGKCTLTMSMDGQSDVVREVATSSLTGYTVCRGFDVDVSSLQKGEWLISVDYQGVAGSGTVERKVDIK